MINNVTLGGKIVSDLILRKSKSGMSVIDFRLMYKNKKAKNPLFIDVEAWGLEADRLSETAVKGVSVIVHGELRRDVWEKDGEERSKIKITAEKVIINADLRQIGESPVSF
jgi:single-strand DNA-binding protein